MLCRAIRLLQHTLALYYIAYGRSIRPMESVVLDKGGCPSPLPFCCICVSCSCIVFANLQQTLVAFRSHCNFLYCQALLNHFDSSIQVRQRRCRQMWMTFFPPTRGTGERLAYRTVSMVQAVLCQSIQYTILKIFSSHSTHILLVHMCVCSQCVITSWPHVALLLQVDECGFLCVMRLCLM